jgi:HAD superfamily hydrolase (TIGR01549 family)
LIEIENSYTFFDEIIVEVFKRFGKNPPSSEERDLLWRNVDYKTLLASWNFPDYKLFWKSFDDIDYIKRRELLKKGKINVFEDVIPFFGIINPIKKIISIIITNTTQEIADFELDHFKIRDYFHEVIGLGDTQDLCKPSPEGINSILNELHTTYDFENSDVYIIGDSENDIIAGKSAGIKTVFLNRNEKKTEQNPHFIINSLEDFLKIIKTDSNGQSPKKNGTSSK